MTTSYSDLILQALAKHGRLNTPQLAAKISCDTKKTTQLVSLMRTNKKLKTDGAIDGLAAYSLTDRGRSLVPVDTKAATPSAPASLDDLADSQMRPTKQQAAEPNARATRPVADLRNSLAHLEDKEAPAFGLLNTGEFLIMADGHTIKIPAEYVPVMRAQLGPATAGAFQ
ncbi:hypothetical protein [Achromobacter xylosoxidans]|uniref:Uncharacterized protein n=1 Tax=Alcaligenes xylosoxydans xylosoxydans TaxID=85698 RepID=A0A1R1JMH0_ALCXX|nr:hypothetical protein [Achromobacter xylosoxidans]OMG79328.1 hypothetical protein BIZ92_15130 [Achromobacter xylosoxidans]